MAEREFTGRHALMVFVGGFGVIIAVNLVLAWNAVSSFPGLEVKNSYTASQQFDLRRDSQDALGWNVSAKAGDGRVILSIRDANGAPVEVTRLYAVIGRPTHERDDVEPAFEFDGAAYVAPVALEPGNWSVRLSATASDGTDFTRRITLLVNKG